MERRENAHACIQLHYRTHQNSCVPSKWGTSIQWNKINANVIQIQTTFMHFRKWCCLVTARHYNHRTHRIPDSIFGVPSIQSERNQNNKNGLCAHQWILLCHSHSVMRIGAHRLRERQNKNKMKMMTLFQFFPSLIFRTRGIRHSLCRSTMLSCHKRLSHFLRFFFPSFNLVSPQNERMRHVNRSKNRKWRWDTCACHFVCRFS